MAIRMEQPTRRVRAALRGRLVTMPGIDRPWSAYRPFPVYTVSAASLAASAAIADEAYLIGWRYVVAGRPQGMLCVDINLLEEGRIGRGVVIEGDTADRLFEAGRRAETAAGDRDYWARILDLGFVGEVHLWLAGERPEDDILISLMDMTAESVGALVERAATKARHMAHPASLTEVNSGDLAGGELVELADPIRSEKNLGAHREELETSSGSQ